MGPEWWCLPGCQPSCISDTCWESFWVRNPLKFTVVLLISADKLKKPLVWVKHLSTKGLCLQLCACVPSPGIHPSFPDPPAPLKYFSVYFSKKTHNSGNVKAIFCGLLCLWVRAYVDFTANCHFCSSSRAILPGLPAKFFESIYNWCEQEKMTTSTQQHSKGQRNVKWSGNVTGVCEKNRGLGWSELEYPAVLSACNTSVDSQ